MHPQSYIDVIVRAVREGDFKMLNRVGSSMADAERALEILRAKGYGSPGMTIATTAALTPDARVIPL